MEKNSKGNNEDTSQYETFQKKFKDTIFTNYYSILKRDHDLTILYIILIFVESFQISFLITVNKKYSDFVGEAKEIYSLDSKLLFLSRILTFYKQGDFLQASIFMYLVIALIITVIVIFYLDYYDRISKNAWSKLSLVLFLIQILFKKILMIPIFITFLSFFQSDSNDSLLNFKNVKKLDVQSQVNFVMAIIFLIIYVLINLSNNLFFHDCKPKSKIPWSAPYNYLDHFYLSFKFVLCIMFVFDFENIFLAKNIIVLIICVIIMMMRMNFPLFYNIYGFYAKVYFEGCNLLSAVFAILYQNKIFHFEESILIFQIVGCILNGAAFCMIVFKIQIFFIDYRYSNISSEYVAYRKILSLIAFHCTFLNMDRLIMITCIDFLRSHIQKGECQEESVDGNQSCNCFNLLNILLKENWKGNSLDQYYLISQKCRIGEKSFKLDGEAEPDVFICF